MKGNAIWKYHVIDFPFKDDTWVRAIHIKTQKVKLFHHARVFTTSANEDWDQNKAGAHIISGKMIGGYSPGASPRKLPGGSGILWKKNEKLIVEIHYEPNGKLESDEPLLAVYTLSNSPKRIFKNVILRTTDILIPPNEPDFLVKSKEKILENDFQLYEVFVHMHLRGRDAVVKARLPDGTEKTVLNVLHYSFKWQYIYNFETPIFLPKGSALWTEAHFDNSTKNPANPNPNMTVVNGLQTHDEMLWTFLGGIDS